jgi:hypothetical protein
MEKQAVEAARFFKQRVFPGLRQGDVELALGFV